MPSGRYRGGGPGCLGSDEMGGALTKSSGLPGIGDTELRAARRDTYSDSSSCTTRMHTHQTDHVVVGRWWGVVLYSVVEGRKGLEGENPAQVAAWPQENMEGIPLWGPQGEAPGICLQGRLVQSEAPQVADP